MKPEIQKFRYLESLVHPDILKSFCLNVRISKFSGILGSQISGYLETQQLYLTQQLYCSIVYVFIDLNFMPHSDAQLQAGE